MFSIKIRNIKSRYSVFEMAFDKAKFQDKVTDRIQQIAQNWCLCVYCHLYAPDTRTYHHWKMELFTLLDYLCNLSIKDKKSKTKYSYVAFTRQADYDDESVVFNACRNKFIIEKEIDIPLNKQREVCRMFSDSLKEISMCIGGEIDVLDYIDKTFPEVRLQR